MKRIMSLVAVAIAAGAIASMPRASRAADEAAPVFVTKIILGYRDWRFISVAHEEGERNDIRVILGNDTAIKAYRENKVPFPEGTIIARIAWKHVPSEENNKVFGRAQSFVPGDAPEWYLQFMVKDSKKYSATGGWGTLNLTKTANLPMKRRSKPASLATKKSKVATLSLLATRRNAESETCS
jgi:hypothetical protein